MLTDTIRSPLPPFKRLVVHFTHLKRDILIPFGLPLPDDSSITHTSFAQTYNSLRPLSSWARDLGERIKMFHTWSQTAKAPKAFTIGAFTFPTGFLTAVMQTAARKNGISVDSLGWDFTPLTIAESNIASAPKDGVYVRGLSLEGAGFDVKNTCLIEAKPMMLVCSMPVIHFRALESKKKGPKSKFTLSFQTACLFWCQEAKPLGERLKQVILGLFFYPRMNTRTQVVKLEIKYRSPRLEGSFDDYFTVSTITVGVPLAKVRGVVGGWNDGKMTAIAGV